MVNPGGTVTAVLTEGDWTPLAEAVPGDDGTIAIKIIGAGWSKNGNHYSETLLQKAAAIYRKGTQQFWNHAGPSAQREHPAGDLDKLAAVLSETAHYDPIGPTNPETGEPEGPGIYSRSRPLAAYRDRIAELAGVIGVSHYVRANKRRGTVEGRSGWIIEEILDPATHPKTPAITVDFVTRPAAGGHPLAESDNSEDTMTDEQIQERVTEAVAPLNEAIAAKDAEIARLAEEVAGMKAEQTKAAAASVLSDEIGKAPLPEPAKKRLGESLGFTGGEFDADAYRTRITEAIAAEAAYVASITPAAPVAEAIAPSAPQTGVAVKEGFDRLALAREFHDRTGGL